MEWKIVKNVFGVCGRDFSLVHHHKYLYVLLLYEKSVGSRKNVGVYVVIVSKTLFEYILIPFIMLKGVIFIIQKSAINLSISYMKATETC